MRGWVKIIRSVKLMQRHSSSLKARDNRIGLVPTMGYLHEGHLNLVRRSIKENDITVVSIFVNPAQFGPKEDFIRYPRDFGRDERLLKGVGADVVFYPTEGQMYPQPYHTYVNVERLSDVLCGKSRPGHFRGVATVVTKLFNIVKPDIAYFGQKDAQQAIIIKKMAADLNMDLKVTVMPTVRERDGLAMSSRNAYLNAKHRKDAVVLHESLLLAMEMIDKGERSCIKIINAMKKMVQKKDPAKIDYIEIVNPATLRAVTNIQGEALIAMAVYIGKTRLIDNLKISRR